MTSLTPLKVVCSGSTATLQAHAHAADTRQKKIDVSGTLRAAPAHARTGRSHCNAGDRTLPESGNENLNQRIRHRSNSTDSWRTSASLTNTVRSGTWNQPQGIPVSRLKPTSCEATQAFTRRVQVVTARGSPSARRWPRPAPPGSRCRTDRAAELESPGRQGRKTILGDFSCPWRAGGGFSRLTSATWRMVSVGDGDSRRAPGSQHGKALRARSGDLWTSRKL